MKKEGWSGLDGYAAYSVQRDVFVVLYISLTFLLVAI